MVKEFHINESIVVEVGKTIESGFVPTRLVCPDCKDHHQEKPSRAIDCKNLFWKYVIMSKNLFDTKFKSKKEIVGQCGCYSKEHGVR